MFTLVVFFLLTRASGEVIYQWKQPNTVVYDGSGPYYLSVVESDLDWRGFPLNVERNYLIYVGYESGKPTHGHTVKFSFVTYPDDLKTFLSKAETRWTEDGVELILPSGHRLFIPKKMFLGGR